MTGSSFLTCQFPRLCYLFHFAW